MEGQALKEGKARVKDLLTDHLTAQGMVRKRGVSVEDHAAFLASVEARLAYMKADKLSALAEICQRYAGGKTKDVWPSEQSIMGWAMRLQVPPASHSRLVRTYLQSGAGRAALASGYHAELMGHLKKFGAPPNDYAIATIRRDASDNARRLRGIEKKLSSGAPMPLSEAQWMDGYNEARRIAADIIEGQEVSA